MSLALIFPGQGSQQPGMLHALPSTPSASSTLAEARDVLADLGLSGDTDTAAALQDTTNVQLALVIAGVACAGALTLDFGLAPDFVAGHSVGAFAAAVTTGVLTLPEALGAVRLRGDLMREACAGRSWGMAAVTGLPVRAAQRLVKETTTVAEPLWLANVNSETQTALSGTSAALMAAQDTARSAGARAFDRLDVAVASHCPLQEGTARRLAEHLSDIPRRQPTARYLTNTRGRSAATAEPILDDLAQSVAHPVQWHDATRLMVELGATCAVQTPPGHVLTKLFDSAATGVTAIAMADHGAADAAALARRRGGIR